MFPRVRMFGSLFLLALAVRAIGYPTVFSKAGVQLPYAGDAYYHLRRIWFSVARFPEALSFDRYVSFPEGSQIQWPAAFDWTIAALIRPFVDPSDQVAVEAMAVWVPAVLGAATTGLLALFASRLYGRGAGWCAGLIYSVLPMSFIFSQLGMIDHHVAVALLTTVMLWLACEIFSRDDRAESWAAALLTPATRLSVALGVAMAVTISTWPGSLLHIGVLQVAFGFRWLLAGDRETARARAVAFSVTQAIIAICIAPFTLGAEWREYGAWSPLVMSSFQPLYFTCAAVTVCLVQCLHERDSIGDSRARRAVSGIALALAGVIVSLVSFPPLRDAMLFAGGWFAHGEEILGVINEMRPILAPGGRFEHFLHRHGLGGFPQYQQNLRARILGEHLDGLNHGETAHGVGNIPPPGAKGATNSTARRVDSGHEAGVRGLDGHPIEKVEVDSRGTERGEDGFTNCLTHQRRIDHHHGPPGVHVREVHSDLVCDARPESDVGGRHLKSGVVGHGLFA